MSLRSCSGRTIVVALLATVGCGTEDPDATAAEAVCVGKCDAAAIGDAYPLHPDFADGKLCLPTDSRVREVDDGEVFDYVIVGAGAGGAPLAINLATKGWKVLLLDAGPDACSEITTQVPAWHALSTEDSAIAWAYFVAHHDQESAQTDPKMDGQPGVLYPRSTGVGGCTTHNAMISMGPHDSDWEALADLFADGSGEHWRPAAMHAYFEQIHGDTSSGGITDGRWGLGTEAASLLDTGLASDDVLLNVLFAAAEQAGVGLVSNTINGLINALAGTETLRRNSGGNKANLYSIPLATKRGRRSSPRDAIAELLQAYVADETVLPAYAGCPGESGACPANPFEGEEGGTRGKLVVKTQAFVTNVTLAGQADDEGLVATGVEFIDEGEIFEATFDPNECKGSSSLTTPVGEDRGCPNGAGGARQPQRAPRWVGAHREVIVSAGAFNTPQLLAHSGIGPGGSKLPLSGVGANLQDRYEVGVVYEVRDLDGEPLPEFSFDLLEPCTFGLLDTDECYDQYLSGRGPYPTNGVLGAVVHQSSVAKQQGEPDPDLVIFGAPAAFPGYEVGYSLQGIVDDDGAFNKRRLTWAVLKGHTRNRAGIVEAASHPLDAPTINFRNFAEGGTHDLAAMAEGVEVARSIMVKANARVRGQGIQFVELLPGSDVTGAGLQQWIRDTAWGHHACCTSAMGPDPDAGAVLDAELRVHGTTNLRVVDASVFPEIPGLFIVEPIYYVAERAADLIDEHALVFDFEDLPEQPDPLPGPGR